MTTPVTRPLAPALLLHMCGLRLLRRGHHPNIPARSLAILRSIGESVRPAPKAPWGQQRSRAHRQSELGLRALVGDDGGGPLQRAMRQPGFPACLPLDPQLSAAGSCIHIPGLCCPQEDRDLAHKLLFDVEAIGDSLQPHRSGRHFQIWGDRITESETFTAIVARLLTAFDLSLVDCWVNVYRNGGESKSLHHDNYKDRLPRPTVTIGLSLGEPRELLFEHAPSKRQFRVLQNNGDVFAFDRFFNRDFRHAVPPGTGSGLRLSVILWAVEGQSIAVPAMTRGGRGLGLPNTLRWDKWDLESGVRSGSQAFR